ncbi:acyl-CoA thioesterase [Halofilum ochraceum]|uniref:acyl-CoA thioesterase n=1 Tax=Halofilum ochraceum TaxID=1611323 RepID=UPI001585FC4E|nr:thioesterase family protein [Halofilum ochraceum]
MDRSAFPHWTREKIRFQDIDRLGHVNNVAITIYAESGRVEFLDAVMPTALTAGNASIWVIARLDVQFRAQSHYPGTVEIGTRVLRIGNSSITLGQGLFVGDRCIATTESVVVLVDPDTGRGMTLPDEVREAARPLESAG